MSFLLGGFLPEAADPAIEPRAIIQDKGYTGGNPMVQGMGGFCDKNMTTNFQASWPFIVCIMCIRFNILPIHVGDEINVTVCPDSYLSDISSDISIGTTQITLDTLTNEYGITVQKGYFVKITDGTNTENLGRIIDVDTNNKIITVEVATTNGYTSSTPTQILLSIHTVLNLKLNGPGFSTVGDDKITGCVLPANCPVSFKYTNNSDTTKDFYANLEYLY